MAKPESQYEPKYITQIDKYLKLRADEEYEFHKTRGDKSDSYEKRIRVKLPSIEGFAIFLGVSRKTLYNWRDEQPDFAEALDRILVEQKQRLIDMGLSGDYSPTIAKLILSSNHGMREGHDLTSDNKPIPLLDYAKTRTNDGDQEDPGS